MAKILFTTDSNGVKFYPITIADAVAYIKKDNTQVKLKDFLDSIDYSSKSDKVAGATAGNFAGLDADGNLTDSGKKATDFEEAGTAQAKIDALGGSVSQVAADSNGNIAATITSEKGEVKSISVDASALKSAAANDATTKANAAQAAAEATAQTKDEALESKLVGTDGDTKASVTIKGAKAYAKDLSDALEAKILAGKAYQGTVAKQAALPTTLTEEDAGKYYILTEEGKFAYWNGASWDLVDQETTVINAGASLKVGTAVKVAEIEGVAINVTQVEDTTKIEAVAVADTTDYADVSSLFVAG